MFEELEIIPATKSLGCPETGVIGPFGWDVGFDFELIFPNIIP